MKALSAVGLQLAAMTRKVLLLDVDPASQDQCARILRDCACEPCAANSASGALALLASRKFEVILLDFRLASQGGHDLLTAVKHAQPGVKVILMVEGIGNPPPDQPLRLRGYTLLTKPLKIEDLARAMETPPEATSPPPPGI